MDLPSLALLGVVVAVLLARAVLRERRDYAKFKRMRTTAARQKVFRRWLVEAFLVLGGLGLATVVGAWESIPRALTAAQAWEPVAAVRDFLGTPAGVTTAIVVAVVALAALVLPPILARGSSLDDIPAVGDIRAIIPRSLGELRYGAALSVNAGVTEEVLFRLGMPALVFAVTGDAVVAFVAATALFGVLHVYQGAPGIVFSTIAGVIFTALYVVSGSILLPIAVHALLDLRSMVLLPVALGTVGPRPAPTAAAPPAPAPAPAAEPDPPSEGYPPPTRGARVRSC